MQIGYNSGKISDLRLCGDPECKEPVSLGRTLIKYSSNDPQILSFGINVPVKIFSKSAGNKADLWGGEINGKRGYFPMKFVQEMRKLKSKLEFTVPTTETDGSSDQENTLPGDRSIATSATEHSPSVQHYESSQNEAVFTKPRNLEMKGQDVDTPSTVISGSSGLALEQKVVQFSSSLQLGIDQENEHSAKSVEKSTAINVPFEFIEPSDGKQVGTEELTRTSLHSTLKNVWDTVKESKVLTLPWDSIQTVATFGSNFPKSLDMLTESLIQRIGASADSLESVAEVTGNKVTASDERYSVIDGTTLWNDMAVDNTEMFAKPEVPSPTKRYESSMASPEPNVHLSSSFSQTPEFNKATDTPSLVSNKMERSIGSINSGSTNKASSVSVPNIARPSDVKTQSDFHKSLPTSVSHGTQAAFQNSITPTQSLKVVPVSDAVVSEHAYMGEPRNALDDGKTFQPSRDITSSGSSHVHVEETQWSSSEDKKVGNIQPSATTGKADYIEGDGGWFSTLKRTLLGTNEQGPEEPSVVEDETRGGANSWMGKEGSQGLPRSDSGFVSDPADSQITEEEEEDDTLVDIEDEYDDSEASEATLEDLIAEEKASRSYVKEDASVKENILTSAKMDKAVSDDSMENVKSAPAYSGNSDNSRGPTAEEIVNKDRVAGGEPAETSTSSPIADTKAPADTVLPTLTEKQVDIKTNESLVTPGTVGQEKKDSLPKKSTSTTPSDSVIETPLFQQGVGKRESEPKITEKRSQIVGMQSQDPSVKKEDVTTYDSIQDASHIENAKASPLQTKHIQQAKDELVAPQTDGEFQQETKSILLPSSILVEEAKTGSVSYNGDTPNMVKLTAAFYEAVPSVVDNSQESSAVPDGSLSHVPVEGLASLPLLHAAPKHEERVESIAKHEEPAETISKYEEPAETISKYEEPAETISKYEEHTETEEISASDNESDKVGVEVNVGDYLSLNSKAPVDVVSPSPDPVPNAEEAFDPLSVLSKESPIAADGDIEEAPESLASQVDHPEDAEQGSVGFLSFFEELDLAETGKAYVDWLRPYMQMLIDLLPEPIHASLMDFEEQGLSPRVLVFTVISGSFLAVLIIAYYVVKRSSDEGTLKLKLSQMDKKLFDAAAERDIVKEELESTKQKTIDLRSNLSEAQEAIALLDSELLSAKNEGRKLQESVALLQEQLDLQKNSVSDMQSNAKNKAQQYSALKEEHDDALLKIEDLEMQNKKLRLERDEKESNYESVKQQLEVLEEQAIQFQENNKQLLREAEIWNQRVHELQEQVETYCASNKELRESLSAKVGEIEVLKDLIKQLKVMQDDDTDVAGDSEKLQKLMDVSRVTAELNAVSQEKSCIVEHLSAEIEKRKSLEDSLAKTVTEVEQLRESQAVLSQERDEAYTKLQVLSGYFKEKEIQLQRELGVQEAMRLQSQDSVLTVGQRAALCEQEVSMYKSQIDDLKKEIENQARSYKNQIAQHESKAHDSWLAARAAERKAEDARQESAVLRNKLTLIEQEKESIQGQGDSLMVKPLPKRFTGSNGEVPSPPRLESEPSDLPVSGPPSLLREPLDSPRRMPFLPMDRPMPPPALGFPPPFLRDRFPPPPMYDLHGPPFDLHGPPPPPYLPHHRPFDHRMSPPLPRRSPPLRRMSPPYDPHSPLPPRDYRSPPPIDRRGPSDRLQSPPPFDRRPPSGRHTSPPHLPRERNYPGPYEREFRERSPPRFHDRGPPPGVLAPGMRQGPPPLRRDPFPDNRIGALTDPRTSSPMTDQLPDSPQAHPTTQV